MPTTVVDRATTAPKNDPPPAYVPPSQAATTSEQQLAPPITPVTVRPTNFLSVKWNTGDIRGTYVLDPRIKIPKSMLPPLAAGQTEATRQNLFLHTDHGSIDVDLFVLGDAHPKRSLDMSLKCKFGNITVKLHAVSTARPPIYITATTDGTFGYGKITLHLPRTFRGPVTVRQTADRWRAIKIHISELLTAGMMPLSEANDTWRYFVGTLDGWTGEGKWAGDEVRLESGLDVRLQYDVEPDLPVAQNSSSGCLVC
ncbi:hypothetical protein B0H16DRAFT_1732193 [Mycena metata]|uniref:DUF7330 domain-containing protein n=1 Tax=Mycena metata TaxID=1033252 RepID=A0AAD7MVC3_9AGAR|nr:hypothetical protein B0H16DRAFT_1732193 [Mycena metata]